MSSWHSNSRVFLALLVGALLPFAMPPSAQAGDKIEFSAPVDSLAVPQVEREDKEPVKNPSQLSIGNTGPEIEENFLVYSETVIVSTPKKKHAKTEDPASIYGRDSRDSLDSDSDADSDYDKVDSSRQPANGPTNRWDAPREWNSDVENAFSGRKGDDTVKPDSFHMRMEAVTAAGRSDYQKAEFYDRHSPDSNDDTPWSRSDSHHHYGATGLEGTREGQFVPLYGEMKTLNEQAAKGYSAAQAYNDRDGLPYDSASTYSRDGYGSPMGDSRGKTADETIMSPRMYRPAETSTTVSPSSDVFARQEPPPSPRGEVQSPPAILPFPKRPGSVFQ